MCTCPIANFRATSSLLYSCFAQQQESEDEAGGDNGAGTTRGDRANAAPVRSVEDFRPTMFSLVPSTVGAIIPPTATAAAERAYSLSARQVNGRASNTPTVSQDVSAEEGPGASTGPVGSDRPKLSIPTGTRTSPKRSSPKNPWRFGAGQGRGITVVADPSDPSGNGLTRTEAEEIQVAIRRSLLDLGGIAVAAAAAGATKGDSCGQGVPVVSQHVDVLTGHNAHPYQTSRQQEEDKEKNDHKEKNDRKDKATAVAATAAGVPSWTLTDAQPSPSSSSSSGLAKRSMGAPRNPSANAPAGSVTLLEVGEREQLDEKRDSEGLSARVGGDRESDMERAGGWGDMRWRGAQREDNLNLDYKEGAVVSSYSYRILVAGTCNARGAAFESVQDICANSFYYVHCILRQDASVCRLDVRGECRSMGCCITY